jgi:hypothetical protein
VNEAVVSIAGNLLPARKFFVWVEYVRNTNITKQPTKKAVLKRSLPALHLPRHRVYSAPRRSRKGIVKMPPHSLP